MSEEKNQYYFHGKCFEEADQMFEYAKKWREFPLDQETAERILDTLKKDIIMNVFLCGNPFDNAGFRGFVEKIFEFSMKKLNDERGNER